MKFEDCIKFANENPRCWLATVDNGKPRVRVFGMLFANEGGFYFSTGTHKEVYKQLQEDSTVELGFYQPGEMMGTMMRVAGKVEFLDDQEFKKTLLEDIPFLKQFPNLVIFRVPKGEVHFWTMATNSEPKMMIKFED